MVMMVQANGALENEEDEMEHTLRSEGSRTFSWVSTSRSIFYLLHMQGIRGRASTAGNANDKQDM